MQAIIPRISAPVSTLWSLLIQATAVYRSTNTSRSPVFSIFFYVECVYDLMQ